MSKFIFVPLAALLSMGTVYGDDFPVRVGAFDQEIAVSFGVDDGLTSADIHAVAADPAGNAYAATAAGLLRYEAGRWLPETGVPQAPVTGLHPHENGVFYTLGNGLYLASAGDETAVDVFPGSEIHQFCLSSRGPVVATDAGLFSLVPAESGGTVAASVPISGEAGEVRQIAASEDGAIAVAGAGGLFRSAAEGAWERLEPTDGLGRAWAVADVRGAAYDHEGFLWVAMPAGIARETGEGWQFYTGQDGLPYNDFTCAASGEPGVMWFGTTRGAIRFDGTRWDYRQGLGWLPDDDVRGIAVDEGGNAWFATSKGLGLIKRQPMRLMEKADVYEREVEQYIKRTPFGYTSEVGLKVPGDKSSEVLRGDSDNDGLWTGMYGAGECYAYAATRRPESKQRAKAAFEALRFLQKVTQGGEHAPPKGFVARTVRSVDLPDPNIGRVERDKQSRASGDSLWKVYEPRWPKSADGKWFWKSDTSSDELDGHYFFYPLYHDLVAEDEEEKARVREVVRDLTDHLLDHGFYLVDHDGTKTRWSIFGPASLNNDPNWWPERGLNSLSILSYLTVAEHMTGDSKYGDAVRMLVDEHGYRANLMFPKAQYGMGSGNQSDDEMAFMSFYNLIRYTKDDELREEARYAFYAYWCLEAPEMNPFFNFCYAAVGLKQTYTNPWGTWPIAPWRGWLDDAVTTLKGFPLDRLNWAHQNSHRIDLVPLPRQQLSEPYEAPSRARGHRVNGKVLPVENRHFNHWNTDPWTLDYGGNGGGLASGTVFLLPYYMGLYHGFIETD